MCKQVPRPSLTAARVAHAHAPTVSAYATLAPTSAGMPWMSSLIAGPPAWTVSPRWIAASIISLLHPYAEGSAPASVNSTVRSWNDSGRVPVGSAYQ
jgi:hypothetical protein